MRSSIHPTGTMYGPWDQSQDPTPPIPQDPGRLAPSLPPLPITPPTQLLPTSQHPPLPHARMRKFEMHIGRVNVHFKVQRLAQDHVLLLIELPWDCWTGLA